MRITGDGVAARCCAHLLAQAGYSVHLEQTARARVPTIMLGELAQRLIRDVFGKNDLFRDLPRIERRIVAWGPGATPAALDHSAVVLSEQALLSELGGAPDSGPAVDADWSILSAPPLPEASRRHGFGSRMASPVAVELNASAEPNAGWIESLEDGWLFLNSGWLAAIGAEPDTLLGKSRLVAPRIARIAPAEARFPAFPRVNSPLAADAWFACGSAAMAFDPICGDGTAHAVREAILAAAAVRAVDRGEAADRVRAHYEARLLAGFERHLIQCRPFYASGGDGAWWRAELEAIDAGISWCRERLQAHGPFLYRLNGLELEPL